VIEIADRYQITKQKLRARFVLQQSPPGYRFTTRVRLRIMKRPPGFSAIAAAKAARTWRTR
jgi:hypothetical protein